MDSEHSDRFLSTIQIKERVKDILTEYRLQIFLSRQQIYIMMCFYEERVYC